MTTVLVGLIICAGGTAFAQSGDQAGGQEGDGTPSFEDLIANAKEAYDAEDYDAAIDHLLAANRLQANARLLLNVAKSYEKLGDCVSAQVYYRAFVRDPEAEKALIPAAKGAIEKADECEGWDPLMSGRTIVSSAPPGATVAIDGEEAGETPTEIVGIMEGQHVVSVTLDGYEPAEKSVDLLPDRDKTIEFELKEKPKEVAQPEPEREPQPPPETDEGGSPVVHYAIAGGVAAVGIGLFTVGLLTDLGIPEKYDEPRRTPGVTDEEYTRLTEEREGAVTRALVFYVAGGVLVAGGAGYAAYVAATSGKEKRPTLTLAPAFGPNGAGLVLSGDF